MFFCVAVVQMISVDWMADDACPHSLCHSCIELLIAERAPIWNFTAQITRIFPLWCMLAVKILSSTCVRNVFFLFCFSCLRYSFQCVLVNQATTTGWCWGENNSRGEVLVLHVLKSHVVLTDLWLQFCSFRAAPPADQLYTVRTNWFHPWYDQKCKWIINRTNQVRTCLWSVSISASGALALTLISRGPRF